MKCFAAQDIAARRRRSSHEERGLKFLDHILLLALQRRSSHEERGLKWILYTAIDKVVMSLLA